MVGKLIIKLLEGLLAVLSLIFTSSLRRFLFGKDPDIFDDRGNVVHRLPKKKWDDWANRYKMGAEYNWRNHTGTLAGAKSNQNKS